MGIRKTHKRNKILSVLTSGALILSGFLPGGFLGTKAAHAAFNWQDALKTAWDCSGGGGVSVAAPFLIWKCWTEDIPKASEAALNGVIGAILGFLQLLGDWTIGLLDTLFRLKLTEPTTIGLGDSKTEVPALLNLGGGIAADALTTLTQIVDGIFLLAILFFSLQLITGTAKETMKKTLTLVITTFILAHFAPRIAVMLIDLGSTLTEGFLRGLGGSFDIISKSLGSYQALIAYTLERQEGTGELALLILGLFFQLVTVAALIKLLLMLIERIIRLIYLTVVSPFYFAIGILPDKELQSYRTQWWSELLRWILALPLAAVILQISMSLIDPLNTLAAAETGIEAMLFPWALATAGMVFAGNIPQILKLPMSTANQAVQKAINPVGWTAAGGMALGRAAWKPVSQTAQIGWLNAKDKAINAGTAAKNATFGAAGSLIDNKLGRVGQAITKLASPAENAKLRGIRLQQLKDLDEARKTPGEKVAEKRKNQLAIDNFNKANKAYKDGFDKYLRNQGIQDKNLLSGEKKAEFEAAFRKANPALANNLDLARTAHTKALVAAKEEVKNLNQSDEQLENNTYDAIAKTESLTKGSDAYNQARTDAQGSITNLIERAAGSGPGAVGAKLALARIMNNKSMKDKLEALGVTWFPPKAPVVSAEDESKYRSLQRKAGSTRETAQVQAELATVSKYLSDPSHAMALAAYNSMTTSDPKLQGALSSLETGSLNSILNDRIVRNELTTLPADDLKKFRGLKTEVQDELEDIMSSGLGDAAKEQQIASLLQSNDVSAPGAAKLVMAGIKSKNIGGAKYVADQAHLIRADLTNYINGGGLEKFPQTEIKLKREIELATTGSKSHESYEAITRSKLPAVNPQAYAQAKTRSIDALIQTIEGNLASQARPDEAISKSLTNSGLSNATIGQLATLAQEHGLNTLAGPNTNITNSSNFEQHMTPHLTLDMLYQLREGYKKHS